MGVLITRLTTTGHLPQSLEILVTHLFQKPDGPWLHQHVERGSKGSAVTSGTAAHDGVLKIRVDGQRMESFPDLFVELGAAFRFPSYFGNNFNALDDVLTDLEWLPAEGYLVEIDHADRVLIQESDDDFAAFLKLLQRVAEEWSHPVAEGESWDRPAKPFHVVLASDTNAERVSTAIVAAGVVADRV